MAEIIIMKKKRQEKEKAEEELRKAGSKGSFPPRENSNGSGGSGEKKEDQPATRDSTNLNSMDADGDGVLEPNELKNNLHMVSIRLDMMTERLVLERDLGIMLFKIPFFLTCLLCFLVALLEFSPAEEVAKVHKHIENHFNLNYAKAITTFGEIYQYIEDFEKRNEELQATSAKYWCEKRYFTHKWNGDMMVPKKECASPRFNALTVGERSSQISWVEWKQSQDPDWTASHSSSTSSGTSGSHSSSSSSGTSDSHGGRRLMDYLFRRDPPPRRAASSSSNLDEESLPDYPPCADHDVALAEEEGIEGATCESEASHVCEADLGIVLCPKTCGYCAPFQYERIHQFPKPQLTMLPIVVYQTRFELEECHGYAHKYEAQETNGWLNLLPALDGFRNDKLIQCINRKKAYQGNYAIEQECGDGAGSYCSRCSFDASKLCIKEDRRVDFHGLSVYPKVIIEPHRDIMRMYNIDWLDIQTDTVSLSTVIYTEGSEIFTSLTVDFAVDTAGNLIETHRMISYRDLTNEAKDSFIACMAVCSAMAFIGVIVTILEMYITGIRKCKWSFEAYELLSRSLLFAYPLVLLISWSQQIPMSEEVDHLLHSFLDMKYITHRTLHEALEKYFEVKDHMYQETSWLKRHRVVANIVVYFQFWQLMLYFSAHPRMAMLTDTIAKAMTNIIHFLFLFMILFVMMAFMAHWQLGEFIQEFSTYGDAISAQGRMIFGEFIYAYGAERLQGVMMFMYWLYAFTFLLVMWGLLLNFFLAIVVDAFADVNAKHADSDVVKNFFVDVCDVIWGNYLRFKMGWPSRRKLIEFLEEVAERHKESKSWIEQMEPEDKTGIEEETDNVHKVYPEEIAKQFPNEFGDPLRLSTFMCHYHGKMSKLLRRRDHPSQAEKEPDSAEAQEEVAGNGLPEEELPKSSGDVNKELAKLIALNTQLLNRQKEMEKQQSEMAQILHLMNCGTNI